MQKDILTPTESEIYPSLSLRIQSSFIDTLVFLILIILFMNITDSYTMMPNWIKVVFIGLLAFYEPLFQTFGCTLGNYIRGIRVRNYKDSSKKINFLQAIIRYPVKMILGWISFLTIHSNPKRRAIHDIISGTIMVIRK